MKIIVLNGSPKGDLSVTMQYILFLQMKFSQHELKIINVAQKIKKLEKNRNSFLEIIEDIKLSDGIIWGFPLYYMLVCSQYKRFIELIYEYHAQEAFQGKYSSLLTTSIKFFDHTAINYIHAICDDLEMNYIDDFSAHMNDLLNEAERRKLILFAEKFFYFIENKIPTVKYYHPIKTLEFDYFPNLNIKEDEKIKNDGKRIIIITDSLDGQTNLGKMIEKFKNCFLDNVEIINLYDLDIKGGCLGCLHCSYDNHCIYENKDEFIDFWTNKLKIADIIIFAGVIKDRYLSSRWKMFFDRSFFNGHIPGLMGKQFGFLISGLLNQNANLRQILISYVEMNNSNLVDIITDEFDDSIQLDLKLFYFAKNLVKFSKENYIKKPSFLYYGGKKIFRDEIYKSMRSIFQADHRYYKKHGYYDFPKKPFYSRIMMLLFKNKKFREIVFKDGRMKKEMVKPYQKLIQKE